MVMKMPPVKDRGPKLPLTKLNLSASGARPNQRQKPPLSSILLDGSVLMPSLADSEAVRARCDDRGVPTEEVLAEMRAADPPVHYLVGTPKGRLTRLEKHLIAQPWQQARPGVQVKLLAQEGELYVLAQSRDRVAKEIMSLTLTRTPIWSKIDL